MRRDDGHLPGLPVAIPRPSTASPPVTHHDDRDDRDDDDDPEAPIDWRIGGAVVGLLWAAFSSLMLSVAPPTAGTLGAWALATTIATAVVAPFWRAGVQHARARLYLTSTTSTMSSPVSAPRQALEQRATTDDVHRIEERLDEDPA